VVCDILTKTMNYKQLVDYFQLPLNTVGRIIREEGPFRKYRLFKSFS
jgi:hypothetical protein